MKEKLNTVETIKGASMEEEVGKYSINSCEKQNVLER